MQDRSQIYDGSITKDKQSVRHEGVCVCVCVDMC